MLAVTVSSVGGCNGRNPQGRGQERGGEAVPLLDYILISRSFAFLGCYLTVFLGGENLWILDQRINAHRGIYTVQTS